MLKVKSGKNDKSPDNKPENLVNYLIFENRKGCMSLRDFSERFGYPVKTLYDWRHRPGKYKAPKDLFLKFNREIFVRLDVLHSWLVAQNPEVPGRSKL